MHYRFFVIAFSLIAAASAANAAVTLSFATGSSKLTHIQNAAGTATGGLRYGIVVDTIGNGFYSSGTSYDGFAFPASGTGLFLSQENGTGTDDYFYNFGTTTIASVAGTDGGNNAVTGTLILNKDLSISENGISAGDRFALIWFDSLSTADEAKYGFLTVVGMNLPANGVSMTNGLAGLFEGTDPVRTASFTLGAVPEPSRALFFGFGLIGVFFRRRR